MNKNKKLTITPTIKVDPKDVNKFEYSEMEKNIMKLENTWYNLETIGIID